LILASRLDVSWFVGADVLSARRAQLAKNLTLPVREPDPHQNAGQNKASSRRKQMSKENDLEGPQDMGGKHGGQAGKAKPTPRPKTIERDADVVERNRRPKSELSSSRKQSAKQESNRQ
jgi:hypothetical protein